MIVDTEIIFIASEALIIIVLLIILLIKDRPLSDNPESDPYLQQLRIQTKELGEQLARLKNNYMTLGLLDSLQARSMDTLLNISNRNASTLRKEAQTYRTILEEMKTREWRRLSEIQKAKEIQDALNFLKRDEIQN